MPIITKENFAFQKWIAFIGVLLFFVKLLAWYLTQSVAILTDMLESIVNVASGFIGLYSLYLASIPKDRNHPYGHGKVEFVSAGIEGGLITAAGILIIFEAVGHLKNPHPLQQLDKGMGLVLLTAIANYLLGFFAVKKGKKNKSLALIAAGKHLQSDTYTTIGIVLGLILIYFTDIIWLDAAVAIFFALVIIFTGYKILRESLAGIMDEADSNLLEDVVDILQKNRKENWIDIHNFRIIKYGTTLHFDCHLTLPWYFDVREAHQEIDQLEDLVKARFGQDLELFVHADACQSYSCVLCQKKECTQRARPFEQSIVWTVENIVENKKHQ
ncbi:cation diffusion facilitator family transporter [Hugenholtzia roseola]|uniref:cation diffusion facilitator family transporter n=1 Tax=Hugenholtzia roseola TaxID=1002 RepID=UPI0004137F03|nr:cation diffusion facilitator family transporter [Hugenholtzia roseola]